MPEGGIKVFEITVDERDFILVRCPACSRKHTVSVARFKGKKSLIKVRCHCMEVFALELEFQKKPHPPPSISGRYENCSQGNFHGQLQIVAFTPQGLDFITIGRNTIRKGDKLRIDYYDKEAGFKKKKITAVVNTVHGTKISCHFGR